MKLHDPVNLVLHKLPHTRAGMLAAIPLTLLPAVFPSVAVADGPLFAAPFRVYDSGNPALSLAIGDLDGDGKPDLATANFGPATVSVLLAPIIRESSQNNKAALWPKAVVDAVFHRPQAFAFKKLPHDSLFFLVRRESDLRTDAGHRNENGST